jgi:regulator of protease activity HflC (stomatin/prohibitin superfamily)
MFLLIAVITLSGCRVIRQGDVGVKRTLGKIHPKALEAGPRAYNPFVSVIFHLPIRTVNLEVNLDLPSKEGVNVNAEISILYRVDGRKATQIVETIGSNYEQIVILPVFRASAADITAKFMAKDMHTGNRLEIEDAIKRQMMQVLDNRGFIIEAVLLKSIKLPKGLSRAIEEKMEAEQEAQRMEFILLREKQEADRKLIEAEGIMRANSMISEGLTPEVLQYKSIEAFRELSKSNNTKIIITDGKTPMLIE